MAQGKVKIKEMGLREGHPEKEGVLVDLANVVPEIKSRLKRRANLEGLFQEAEGLKVVDGIKGAAEKVASEEATQEAPSEGAPAVPDTKADVAVPDTLKSEEESPASLEAIGAVPAS